MLFYDRLLPMNTTRHLFLWGKPQVGKTTLINRLLADHPDWKIRGIRSYSDFKMSTDAGTPVYIEPVHSCTWYMKEMGLVGLRGPEGRIGFPKMFDDIGVRILKDCHHGDLFIIDEIGTMENQATNYQQAILQMLEAQTPILGVIKRDETTFLNTIRHHPSVCLLEITPENREDSLIEANRMVSQAIERFHEAQNSPSCGAVVLRKNQGTWETLLIATRNGHWSFPKGHQEFGETEQETAQREILEETGVTIQIDQGFRRELPTIEKNNKRLIVCFIAYFQSGEARPQLEEIGGLTWVPLEQAPTLAARYPQDAQVFRDVIQHLSILK